MTFGRDERLPFPGNGLGLGFSLSVGTRGPYNRRVFRRCRRIVFVVKMRVFENWTLKITPDFVVKCGLSAHDLQKHMFFNENII